MYNVKFNVYWDGEKLKHTPMTRQTSGIRRARCKDSQLCVEKPNHE